MMHAEKLRLALTSFNKVHLTDLPTPLHGLDNLGKKWGITLMLKRDDLTSLAMGGDKPRKLSFEIGRAISLDCSTIITCGSSQSNQARLTSAACARYGLKCYLVLSKDDKVNYNSNLMLCRLFGAEIRFVESDDHWDLEDACRQLKSELENQGLKPYVIPVSGTTGLSCLGYVECGLEMHTFNQLSKGTGNYFLFPFGTGGIMAGTVYALQYLGYNYQYIGISVNRNREQCHEYLDKWWSELNNLLQSNLALPLDSISIDDSLIGGGYGQVTDDQLDSISMLATHEGILTDPVYSGKVFHGLRSKVESGEIVPGSHVTMLHSGGVPALFAYNDEFKLRDGDSII